MDIKKIASLEELESLKNLLNFENSGNNEPLVKRKKILVDFTKPCGKINNISERYNIYVNTDTVFKNFEADDKDNSNYDFTLVDAQIRECAEKGETVICNLYAETLPKDAEKWARICETIIARYDGISYIGIWNTPENALDVSDFWRLYKTTSSHIKKCFPDKKVGGASFETALSDYIHEFLNLLLCDKTVPFDFFSWNCKAYKTEQVQNAAYAARTLLDKYGFTETESILSGWKYEKNSATPEKNKAEASSEKGAAFVAGTLIGLSKLSLDVAKYSGALYEKTELTFKAFGTLSDLGIKVTSDTAADHVYVLGAKNDDKGAFMIANYNPYEEAQHTLTFDLKGIFGKKCEIYLLDKEHNLEMVCSGKIPEEYNLHANSVLLVKLI